MLKFCISPCYFCCSPCLHLPVIMNNGPNLFPVFFRNITEMGWSGQFNFDFMYMLLLSGSYITWRHKFSAAGLCLSLVCFFLCPPFLSTYLMYHFFPTEGDVAAVLLGQARVS